MTEGWEVRCTGTDELPSHLTGPAKPEAASLCPAGSRAIGRCAGDMGHMNARLGPPAGWTEGTCLDFTPKQVAAFRLTLGAPLCGRHARRFLGEMRPRRDAK